MAVKSLIDNLPRKQHRLVEEFIEAQQRGSRPSQEAVQAMRDCFGAASSSVLGVEDSTGMVDGALSAIMSAMSHNEEEERATRACAACGKDEDDVGGGKLKQCAKCHSDKTFYCSRDCQKNDWKDHKRICGKKVPLPPTRFVGTQFGSESATVYHGF